MKRVKYIGKPVRLGRFGRIRKGNLLVLTEKEYADVSEDKERFRLAKDNEIGEVEAAAKKLVDDREKQLGEQDENPDNKIPKQSEEENQQLKDAATLEKANDPAANLQVELDAKSKVELYEYALELKAKGYDIKPRKADSSKALKSVIKLALGVTRNPGS